ncbi:hypothetical protein LNP00_06110 [Fructobacillus sp. M158]|uniref:hypothetical protein n=1 Tax=Fructobacillus parabroussonetiae TaxID=2713174 RepID=UPI00200AC68E|nr:hypothetical protein [Fructobacillus parabroussonetiae]MCK8617925.1 hypothetical protein [Fructobacillus parabroussonetiae]
MKEFINQHIVYFLIAMVILESLILFSPLGKNGMTSIILNLILLVCASFVLVGVRSNKKNK